MPIRRVDLNDYTLDPRAACREAADVLRAGELVSLPTETVYGIAARPDVAAEKLAALRGPMTDGATRPPMTPHLAGPADVEAYGVTPGEVGDKLLRKLWPGPVAVVFEVDEAARTAAAAKLGVPVEQLYSSDGRVTLRCPSEPYANLVLQAAGQPTVVTRLGLPKDATDSPPTDAALDACGVSLALDAGPTRYGRPSTMVRVAADGQSYEVLREGIYDRRILERLLRTTLLFVCSGNTCRSPMAMAVARPILAEKLGLTPDGLGDAGYDIISAGTSAMPGMRATPAAADAVLDLGGDLGTHRSQPLDVALIHRADRILAMGEAHRQTILSLVPSAADKTFLLDPAGDIEDPIGLDAATYREMAGRLQSLVRDRVADFPPA
jgi:protein-tyrosine phosphatase